LLFTARQRERRTITDPVRYNWTAEYRGTAMVVYGHTPIAEPECLNRTIKGLGSRWFSER